MMCMPPGASRTSPPAGTSSDFSICMRPPAMVCSMAEAATPAALLTETPVMRTSLTPGLRNTA